MTNKRRATGGGWRLAAALVFAIRPIALAAQTPTGTIVGRVLDSATSEPRAGTGVAIVGTTRGAIADSTGAFIIAGVPAGNVTLRARLIGYHTVDRAIVVRAGDTTRVEFRLTPEVTVLGVVRTEAHTIERDAFESRPSVGTVQITARAAEGVPKFGEADIMRVVQLLPGVEARNDFSTGLNVRGGESDQNLILIDGFPIYNPFHLGGLFSTFIDPTVRDITLMTGGFPARYGGRLSSVLDVHSAEEVRSGVHGTAELSVLATTGELGGAFAQGKGSWMVAGRRTYADKFVSLISDQSLPYHFRDEQAHFTYALTPRTKVALTVYDGSDALNANIAEFGDSTDAKAGSGTFLFSWGNRVVGGSLAHNIVSADRGKLGAFFLGDSATLEQRASVSTFSTTLDIGDGSLRLFNHVSDRRLAGNLTAHTDTHERSFGYDVASYGITYNAGSTQADDQIFALHQGPTSGAVYFDDLWRASTKWLLDGGLRAETVTGTKWLGVSPRLAAKYFVTPDLAFTAALGRFSQWTHSLAREDIPVRLFDFWVTSDSTTPVSNAWHYILGTEQWFGRSRYARVEGFYKKYDHLTESNPQDDLRRRGDEFFDVDGDSYGVDVLVRQLESGRFSGWLSYTYAVAARDENGVRYFPGHDRRHDVNLVGTWRFSKYLIGVRFGYATGTPYTNIVGEIVRRVYDPGVNDYGTRGSGSLTEFIGGPRNGARLPTTQRLDLDVTRHYRWRGATISPYVSLVNAYNAKNVFIYVFDYTKNPPTRQAISQFPILPSAGVTIQF